VSILDVRRGGDRDGADGLATLEAGLDALEVHEVRRVPFVKRAWSASWPPAVAVGLFLLVWELVYRSGWKEPYALPSPGDVALSIREQTVGADAGQLLEAIATSLQRGATGFVAAVAIGTPLGLLIARSSVVRRGIGPIVSGLQSLPSVAWVPAAILFFGLTDAAIYAVLLLGAVPSIANGMVSGIDQVPPLFSRVGRVLGANGLQQARYVLLPAALPGYLAGLRQGWAFSWRSLMAAELITNSPELGLGLGQLLDQSRQVSDAAGVYSGILAILTVGIAVELCLFTPVERRILSRRGLGVPELT
jgi:NitT/TauT family transport system permease protein